MATQARRDAAAKAIFISTYDEDCRDDPEFPVILWGQMTDESRSIYYRWADAALDAAATISDS